MQQAMVGAIYIHLTCSDSGFFVSVGPITCMTALHQPPTQHQRGNQAGQRLLPDTDRWQLLTGHTSGQVKMWSAAAVQPLRPLAILGAPTVSPVKSLVVLADQQLLCFAHADGHLALHTAPNLTVSQPGLSHRMDTTSQSCRCSMPLVKHISWGWCNA